MVLGAIEHGSRLNLMLRQVRRFNRRMFLGCLLLAIGQFGRLAVKKLTGRQATEIRLVDH